MGPQGKGALGPAHPLILCWEPSSLHRAPIHARLWLHLKPTPAAWPAANGSHRAPLAGHSGGAGHGGAADGLAQPLSSRASGGGCGLHAGWRAAHSGGGPFGRGAALVELGKEAGFDLFDRLDGDGKRQPLQVDQDPVVRRRSIGRPGIAGLRPGPLGQQCHPLCCRLLAWRPGRTRVKAPRACAASGLAFSPTRSA